MSFTLLLAGLVLTLGGIIQGVVGFGLTLLAVPILAMVEPDLLPGPLLLVASAHAVLSVWREHEHVDWRGVAWAMLGRLPGTVIGVLVVDSLPPRVFFLVVGLGVLGFTLLSMVSWHPQPTPMALTVAGLISGAFGTAMAIGGPPVALLYQHQDDARVRSTLCAYFMLGAVLSVGSLALAGHLNLGDVASAGILLPFLLAGFVMSGPARRLVAGGRIRYAVLGFAGISALMLIARSLLS